MYVASLTSSILKFRYLNFRYPTFWYLTFNFVKISCRFLENSLKMSGKFLGEKVRFNILASSAFRKYSTCWTFFILCLCEKINLISLHCRNLKKWHLILHISGPNASDYKWNRRSLCGAIIRASLYNANKIK